MKNRILLLGNTGKMGTALTKVLEHDFNVIGKNSKDFDANDFQQVRFLIEQVNPNIVINTVAYLGIDPCEENPEKAIKLNTHLPKFLAQLSNKHDFIFVHFSTDAVFKDTTNDFYTEKDCPHPQNIYGLTKYGGDCFIKAISNKYYIFRIPVLFGESLKNAQFVEKMLQKIMDGEKVLSVSSDIISSPSYSLDIARKVKQIIDLKLTFGLYHIANEGIASLHNVIEEIVINCNFDVEIKKASYKDFPHIGVKNTCTMIKSCKIDSLRNWREAIKEYCETIMKVKP